MPDWIVAFGVSLFTVLAGLGITLYFKIADRVGRLEVDMATTGTKLTPLWAKVQERLSKDLHDPNPNYAEMDRLLEKLESMTITSEERVELKMLILKRSKDTSLEVNNEERKSALLMLQVMDKVLVEKASLQEKIVGKVAQLVFWAAGASVALTNALRNWK